MSTKSEITFISWLGPDGAKVMETPAPKHVFLSSIFCAEVSLIFGHSSCTNYSILV